jgi:4-hydroxy-tetrahydrodipicolinate reductase
MNRGMEQHRLRVAIAGVRGKMGRITKAELEGSDRFSYVGGLVRSTPGEAEFSEIAQLVREAKPQVIVDFTHFPASRDIALASIENGVRPVIGTSGYGADDIAQLRRACERTGTGCILAPNFAVGAVLMMRYAADAARYFDTVEIVEAHESGKLDAPSGTAMATARSVAAVKTFSRPGTALLKADGARGAEVGGVGVHSLRLPGAISSQEVIFGGTGETLRIAHESVARTSFMHGVTLAIAAAADLTRFVDGLGELL